MPITGFETVVPNNRSAVDPKMIQNPTSMQMAFEPNGLRAAAARGANVYMGGLPNAPGAGRPRNAQLNFGNLQGPALQQALQRRIQQYAIETQQHNQAAKERL